MKVSKGEWWDPISHIKDQSQGRNPLVRFGGVKTIHFFFYINS